MFSYKRFVKFLLIVWKGDKKIMLKIGKIEILFDMFIYICVLNVYYDCMFILLFV